MSEAAIAILTFRLRRPTQGDEMTALEKIRKIASFLRDKHGQETAHRFEVAVLVYATMGNESEHFLDEPISLVWAKTKEIIDLWQGSKKGRLYVSEVVDLADLKKGKLNLVYAPCGSGKTFFVENTLKSMRGNPRQNMLYLSPTVALVNALKFRGESSLGRERQSRKGMGASWNHRDDLCRIRFNHPKGASRRKVR